MPSLLATTISIIAIAYLLWMDMKKDNIHSRALWIPFFWMFLAGSRYVSQWLNMGPVTIEEAFNTYYDGSPIDRTVFIFLLSAGIFVLQRRRLKCGRLLLDNKWIAIYFLFCGLSMVWADYPFISFKRLTKAIGNVVMVLIILTEEHPYEAAGAILRRLAMLLLPLSVLFIKYYPQLGRTYHQGMPLFTGVAMGKNGLGQLCLITGIYFCWRLLYHFSEENQKGRTLPDLLIVALLVWLFSMADSSTALGCMVIAAVLLLFGRMPTIARQPNRIMILGIIFVSVYLVLEMTMDISSLAVELLGRKPTLTSRVPMWHYLLSIAENPVLGEGYENFWIGDRLVTLWMAGYTVHQAHNGYLETYLNLGIVGLALMVVCILSGLMKVRKYLAVNYSAAMLRLSFIVVVIFFNWTEASFVGGPSNVMILFFLGCIDVPVQKSENYSLHGKET